MTIKTRLRWFGDIRLNYCKCKRCRKVLFP